MTIESELEPEGVAERDQFARALGAHHTRQDCGLEDGPLLGGDFAIAQQRRERGRQHDDRRRVRRAPGHGLVADVHHSRAALGIEVT